MTDSLIPKPVRDAIAYQMAIHHCCEQCIEDSLPHVQIEVDAVCAVIEAHCEQMGWKQQASSTFSTFSPSHNAEQYDMHGWVPVFRWLPSPRKDTTR